MRNSDAADDLAQEFAYRFLHGDLSGVDHERGRFRDYVKGVLFHLVATYHQKKKRAPALLSMTTSPNLGEECSLAAERDEAFRTSLGCDELLAARTWASLQADEKTTGQPFYTVLRFRADHPDLASAQMAEQLSGPMGKPLTAAGVRKTLERARDRFADFSSTRSPRASIRPAATGSKKN